MNALFTINFRREAYLQEVARRRNRVVALGVWVGYFGIMSLLLGLYGLNCVSLAKRANSLERQTRQLQRVNRDQVPTQLRPDDLALVESYALSTRKWRDRLSSLGKVIPADARLTSVATNPQNMSDASSQRLLVISGELKGGPGRDRMQGVMTIVGSLRADSVFREEYRNIRLTSTRVSDDGSAQFEIECQ